jgi:asparagine synthase (glutamine-hydrolysing)
MCGIAGFIGFRNLDGKSVVTTAQAMGSAILHRGPDDGGIWQDDEAGVVLVHRRLSILDLSPAGHQPMVSASGRYVIVFNGEIYNHQSLRKSLDVRDHGSNESDSITWRGHSDTETLLAGIDAWGLEKTLKQSVGMFSLALWDRKERSLTLARDRMGEKPLYYGWQKGVFLFGSELKAIRAHPAFEGLIDRNAIASQMRCNYIPAPNTIYEGIFKLPPGHCVRVMASSKGDQSGFDLWPYWSFPVEVEESRKNPFNGSDSEAVNTLDALLGSAVSAQMVADVPLGAFLSGGIDSSTIVALMQAQTSRPIKSFTIGFIEEGYNEAAHAKAVAAHLGTDHTELYVSSQQALDVIPKLPTLYDEPFSDSSQIPTFLISQMTRQHVTVSLSGDGGDELFGGYNRYLMTQGLWNKIRILPLPVRKIISSILKTITPDQYNNFSRWVGVLEKYPNLGDKIHKGSDVLSYNSISELYLSLTSHWTDVDLLLKNSNEYKRNGISPEFYQDEIHGMMALDSLTYLPDDILCKVDRAAMGVSLETRVPMLDQRVVEFSWSLPMHMKIRNGEGKWILREVLSKYVPRELTDRPKMGFGIPLDSWLRGPLRDWAESQLSESRLNQEGYFNSGPIRQKWAEHLSGKRNWQYHLWDVLMFQSWLECQRG